MPFWVARTDTFKQGLKDGSIVNLTPPEQMPGYKPASVAVVAVVEEEEAKEAKPDEVEEDVEQTEVPAAPFGAQPMTPVSPAPKVGGVTASTRRR